MGRDNYLLSLYETKSFPISNKNREHSPEKKSRLNIFKLGSHRYDNIFRSLRFIAQSLSLEHSQQFSARLIVIYEKVFSNLVLVI